MEPRHSIAEGGRRQSSFRNFSLEAYSLSDFIPSFHLLTIVQWEDAPGNVYHLAWKQRRWYLDVALRWYEGRYTDPGHFLHRTAWPLRTARRCGTGSPEECLEWSLIHIGIGFDRLHQIGDALRALIDQTYQTEHHHYLSEPGQHLAERTRAHPRFEGLHLPGVQPCRHEHGGELPAIGNTPGLYQHAGRSEHLDR